MEPGLFVAVPPLHQLRDEEEGGELLSVRLRRFQGAKAFPDRVGKLKVSKDMVTTFCSSNLFQNRELANEKRLIFEFRYTRIMIYKGIQPISVHKI